MLVYKTRMHPEASLDPEHCTPKSDARARSSWLHAHIKIVDKYVDVYSPEPNDRDTHMKEDTRHTEEATMGEQGLPHSGTKHQSDSVKEEIDRRVAAEHFNLVPPAAPIQPISFAIPSMGQPALVAPTVIEIGNPYDILAQQGSGSADRDNDKLGFELVSGANTTTSGSRGSRGRDPIPLTPEILHLLDRLEPDKGKQARLLTEHLTRQRQLPSMEHELQQQLEKRAQREIRKQMDAAEVAANKAATQQAEVEKAALEAAMAMHLA